MDGHGSFHFLRALGNVEDNLEARQFSFCRELGKFASKLSLKNRPRRPRDSSWTAASA